MKIQMQLQNDFGPYCGFWGISANGNRDAQNAGP